MNVSLAVNGPKSVSISPMVNVAAIPVETLLFPESVKSHVSVPPAGTVRQSRPISSAVSVSQKERSAHDSVGISSSKIVTSAHASHPLSSDTETE